MTSKRIIYYILAAFVAGNLLLIYLQYNSSKNINNLINGNEKLLSELKTGNELRDLEKGVITIENKIRGKVVTGDTTPIEELQALMTNVQKGLDKLQEIKDDDSSVKFIDTLDYLVHEKINFSQEVLDTFYHSGKKAAENMIATRKGKVLTDEIASAAQQIDSSRQQLLAALTNSIDESGRKARRLGAILIVLVLVAASALFWFVINRIGQQNNLINQLDASEKKVREAAAIKENFMANMSHEIRTPMNAILGFTNLLQKKNLDNETKEYVSAIHKSGENLLAIINDILDLSKIEAGMMRIETAPFSIRGLLHSIETMFREKTKEKGLQFSIHLDDTIPDTLEGDPIRLTQVLVNLIGNAIKFTQKGNIITKINYEEIKTNQVLLTIMVSDTGIGIEKEKLPGIFNRFQQAEDSITRQYGGTGLGLSIVKDLVQLLHGTVQAESEPGKGTTFTVMIPYKISATQLTTAPDQEIIIEKNYDFHTACILVVEDNEINQSLVKHLFKAWELSYDIVNNGKEAVDILPTKKYDLILMDIQMPVMDGYTATAVIRRDLKLTTPIIAMTAHALAGEREKCLGYGMNDYLSKPIRQQELYQLIGQFTKKSDPAIVPATGTASAINPAYQYINLQYMKEISNGNTKYEKTVTKQFIEIIPEDLQTLAMAFAQQQMDIIKHTAHNMKTSVSVMGLTEKLQPYLDILEDNSSDEIEIQKNIRLINDICTVALEEARHFYSSL